MTRFSNGLCRILDGTRSIAGRLGLRQFAVYIVTKTWSGEREGLGTGTTTETRFLVGGQNPKVHQITNEDVIASGGKYTAGDYLVGPITPLFTGPGGGGGYDSTTFDPVPSGVPTEIFWKLTGPNLPAEGAYFTHKADDTDSALRTMITLTRAAPSP